jgi:hypothetical protein
MLRHLDALCVIDGLFHQRLNAGALSDLLFRFVPNRPTKRPSTTPFVFEHYRLYSGICLARYTRCRNAAIVRRVCASARNA